MEKLQFDDYRCNRCGALTNPVYDRREVPREVTRADEGWTTGLAKLLGLCGLSEPKPRDACLCRCHHPLLASICYHCIVEGCTKFSKTWAAERSLARCSHAKHHGPGMTCNTCGYIGNVIP